MSKIEPPDFEVCYMYEEDSLGEYLCRLMSALRLPIKRPVAVFSAESAVVIGSSNPRDTIEISNFNNAMNACRARPSFTGAGACIMRHNDNTPSLSRKSKSSIFSASYESSYGTIVDRVTVLFESRERNILGKNGIYVLQD